MNTTSKLMGVVQGRVNSALADALGNLIRGTYISNVTWDCFTHTLSFYSGAVLKFSCVIDLDSGGDFNLYVFTPMLPDYYSKYIKGYQIRYINGNSGDYIKEYGDFTQRGSEIYKASSWTFTPTITPSGEPVFCNELCLHDPNSTTGDYYIIHGVRTSSTDFVYYEYTTSNKNAEYVEKNSFYIIHNPDSPSDYKKVDCLFTLSNNENYSVFGDWTPTIRATSYFSGIILHDPNSTDNYKFIKGNFSGTLSWSGLSFTLFTLDATSTYGYCERQYISLTDPTTHNILQIVGEFSLNTGETGDSYSDWSFTPYFNDLEGGSRYSRGRFPFHNAQTHRIVKGRNFIEVYALPVQQSATYTNGESYDQYIFTPGNDPAIKVMSSSTKTLRWVCFAPSVNNGGSPENYDDYSFGSMSYVPNSWYGDYWGIEAKGTGIIDRIVGLAEFDGQTEYDEWVFNPSHESGLDGSDKTGTWTWEDPVETEIDPETGEEYPVIHSVPYEIAVIYNLINGKNGQNIGDYTTSQKIFSGSGYEGTHSFELYRFYLPDGKSYKEAYCYKSWDGSIGQWALIPDTTLEVTWKLYGQDGKSYKTVKGTISGSWYMQDPLTEMYLTPSTSTSSTAEWKIYDAYSNNYKTVECLSSAGQSTNPRGRDYSDFRIKSSTNGFWVLHDGEDEKRIYGAMTGTDTISFTISTSSTAHRWVLHTSSMIKTVPGKFALKSGGTAGTYADYNFTLSTSTNGNFSNSAVGGTIFYYNYSFSAACKYSSNSSGNTPYNKYSNGSSLNPRYYKIPNNDNVIGNYVESDSVNYSSSTYTVTSASRVLRKDGMPVRTLTGSTWTIGGNNYTNWVGPDDANPTGSISDGTTTIYGPFVRAGI